MKSTNLYQPDHQNRKKFSYRRFTLWLYTYRKVLYIFTVILIICGSLGLYLGLDYFSKHFGTSHVNTSFFSGLNTYNKETDEAKKENDVDTWIDNNFLARLGATTNNPLPDGTMFFIGNSACKACHNELDVSSNQWSHVGNHPILYNYWRNLGPINKYANSMLSINGVTTYWEKNKYAAPGKDTTSDKPTAAKANVPNTIYNPTTHAPLDDIEQLKTNAVDSYDEQGYSLEAKPGAPGQNNIASIAINRIESSFKKGATGTVGSYLNSPNMTQLSFDAQSYRNYNQDTATDPQNTSYFNTFLKNGTFKVASLYAGSNFKDVTTFPFVGIVRKTYYKQVQGDGSLKEIPAYRLFYTLNALNENQLADFIYWVYTGLPSQPNPDDNINDPNAITWVPFWDTSTG